MDNEFKELEDALKELRPRQPSSGTRWSLAQHLSDLDASETARARRPVLTIISSVAASVLFLTLVWVVFTRDQAKREDDRIARQPTPSETIPARENDSPAPTVAHGGMELIGEEEDYPTTIPFEIKRHLTAEHDLGIVRVADHPPMRKVRREFVRDLLVTDPETGKTYRVQKPESEIILIRMEDF